VTSRSARRRSRGRGVTGTRSTAPTWRRRSRRHLGTVRRSSRSSRRSGTRRALAQLLSRPRQLDQGQESASRSRRGGALGDGRRIDLQDVGQLVANQLETTCRRADHGRCGLRARKTPDNRDGLGQSYRPRRAHVMRPRWVPEAFRDPWRGPTRLSGLPRRWPGHRRAAGGQLVAIDGVQMATEEDEPWLITHTPSTAEQHGPAVPSGSRSAITGARWGRSLGGALVASSVRRPEEGVEEEAERPSRLSGPHCR